VAGWKGEGWDVGLGDRGNLVEEDGDGERRLSDGNLTPRVCVYIYIYIYTHTHTHTWYESDMGFSLGLGNINRGGNGPPPKIEGIFGGGLLIRLVSVNRFLKTVIF